jgi:16S rRNA (adenine1518-N6/adenine1519-N6)-dimethyltransferase
VVASRLPNPPRSMTVLLQRELVERFSASPGGRAWGPVGAKLRLAYDVRVLRRVGTELFWPRPKVESAVARLELRSGVPDSGLAAAYDRLVDGLFQARRKTLGSRLADLLGDRSRALEVLERLGRDPRDRPESLGVEELAELARTLGPA